MRENTQAASLTRIRPQMGESMTRDNENNRQLRKMWRTDNREPDMKSKMAWETLNGARNQGKVKEKVRWWENRTSEYLGVMLEGRVNTWENKYPLILLLILLLILYLLILLLLILLLLWYNHSVINNQNEWACSAIWAQYVKLHAERNTDVNEWRQCKCKVKTRQSKAATNRIDAKSRFSSLRWIMEPHSTDLLWRWAFSTIWCWLLVCCKAKQDDGRRRERDRRNKMRVRTKS